jgi:hypothetical protein
MNDGWKLYGDYDLIAFAAASAAQKVTVLYRGIEYPNKTALKKEIPSANMDEVETLIRTQPLSHAIQNCRQLLQSILDACAPIKEYKGYLTGEGNFRYQVATIQPYKGNRSDMVRPVYLADVREYLKAECNGEEVCGIEADDKLVIEFLKDPDHSIVATRDKDLATVEGIRLYNWKKGELRVVEPIEAKRNFYVQLLMGDSTDFIRGVEGIGEKTAKKLLQNVKDEKLMMTICYTEYLKAYGSSKAWAYLCETAALLHMLRSEDDIAAPHKAWKPCHVPQGVMA